MAKSVRSSSPATCWRVTPRDLERRRPSGSAAVPLLPPSLASVDCYRGSVAPVVCPNHAERGVVALRPVDPLSRPKGVQARAGRGPTDSPCSVLVVDHKGDARFWAVPRAQSPLRDHGSIELMPCLAPARVCRPTAMARAGPAAFRACRRRTCSGGSRAAARASLQPPDGPVGFDTWWHGRLSGCRQETSAVTPSTCRPTGRQAPEKAPVSGHVGSSRIRPPPTKSVDEGQRVPRNPDGLRRIHPPARKLPARLVDGTNRTRAAHERPTSPP